MSVRPDIVAHSPGNQLVLAVEVKAIRGASPEWAAQMRRNLMAYPGIAASPYFLLALPDVFYLWKDAPSDQTIAPEYSIDPYPVLSPYLDRSSVSLGEISAQGLEFLVTAWLRSLSSLGLPRESADPKLNWLFDSGLYEAIKGGSIQTDEDAAA